MKKPALSNWISNIDWQSLYRGFKERQQLRLSTPKEGLLLLSILGAVTGLISAAVIIGFRELLDAGGALILGEHGNEGFEALSSFARFSLCVVGATLVGIVLRLLPPELREVGIGHVLKRVERFKGDAPIKNALVQTLTATLCLLSGQSMGREGPTVHLGASSGSALGSLLAIPSNGVRVLLGAGAAAAIAAAFDTPLAGVIFAMEVILLEYTVFGFTPVIVAAISATALTRYVYTEPIPIVFSSLPENVLSDLPIVALMGAFIGVIATIFIRLSAHISMRTRTTSPLPRMMVAGLVTGLVAVGYPEVMGMGYDTISQLLNNHLGLTLVFGLLLAKLLATSISVGLGMPAGLIGPTLFIGAAAGSAVAHSLASGMGITADSAWLALLGMAAMMGATLQAPLAALIYLLELSADPKSLFPGMLAVISASLVSQSLFKTGSIYHHLSSRTATPLGPNPVKQALQRTGVASAMARDFITICESANMEEWSRTLESELKWCVVLAQETGSVLEIIEIHQIKAALAFHEHHQAEQVRGQPNLFKALRTHIRGTTRAERISIRDSLLEAHHHLYNTGVEVVVIESTQRRGPNRIIGTITKAQIETHLKP